MISKTYKHGTSLAYIIKNCGLCILLVSARLTRTFNLIIRKAFLKHSFVNNKIREVEFDQNRENAPLKVFDIHVLTVHKCFHNIHVQSFNACLLQLYAILWYGILMIWCEMLMLCDLYMYAMINWMKWKA